MNNQSILILGNKTYNNLNANSLIDIFDRNIRCNMGIPSGNNGSIKDSIVLCSHLYTNIVQRKKSGSSLMKDYKTVYKEEYIKNFTDNFNIDEYTIIHSIDRAGPYNSFLRENKCPYLFKKQPRTGIAAICNHILKFPKDKLYVFGFSVNNEVRQSFYVQDKIFQNEENNKSCHDKNSEINIIRWLHDKGFIDATFCLLLDQQPSRLSNDLEPTEEAIKILQNCKIL
jgi:hypothetical protein